MHRSSGMIRLALITASLAHGAAMGVGNAELVALQAAPTATAAPAAGFLEEREMDDAKNATKSCFAEGTTLLYNVGGTVSPVPIENVKEGDLVLTQDTDSNPVFRPVVVTDASPGYTGPLYHIFLENGQNVQVTPNHGMLVGGELVFASQLHPGMGFTAYDEEKGSFGTSNISHIDLLEGGGTAVYNVVVPGFKVVANNILASTKGELTAKAIGDFYILGDWCYQLFGAAAAKQLYRAVGGSLVANAETGKPVFLAFLELLKKLPDIPSPHAKERGHSEL